MNLSTPIRSVVKDLKKPNFVSISPNKTVKEALQVLKENNLLSLPIQSESNANKIVYLVHLLDLVRFVQKEGVDHLNAAVFSLMSLDADEESYHIFENDYQDTVENIVRQFATGKKHKSLVTDVQNVVKPVIVTQTDVVKYFATFYKCNENLKEFKQLLIKKEIISLNRKSTALDGLKLMETNKLLAVPIVDDEGKFVHNFSASDLRGLTSETLETLKLPVLEYLKNNKRMGTTLKEILTVTTETTLREALDIITGNKLHRLWILNENSKVIGVLSLTDILRIFFKF